MPLSKESITKALSDVRSKTPKRKFTQAIELSVKLREIDMKKPEARINENLELPTAADKDSKVAVIAGGDLAVRAKNAGADIIIGREDLDKLGRAKKEARKIAQNYDFFVAEAPLMPQVGKTLGQILGPRVYPTRSEEHTSELQSPYDIVCRLLLEKKKRETNNERHGFR